MSALGYKMLFRNVGTASFILAIVLIVAILASMNFIHACGVTVYP